MLYSSATYIAVVPQGLIYMLHACGRIDILKRKVLSLFPEDNVVPVDIHHNMKVIGKELQDIYDFVYDINDTSGVIYEVTLKVSAIIIPISALLIIERSVLVKAHKDNVHELKHTTVSLHFVILLAATLLICSLPCYYGNLLMTKSMELREAVFFCGWERVWHKPTRKSLIIIMTRIERAIAISSVFYVMNLETLADVFKTSHRLFSILSAAWTLEY
ncbi:7tm odorant receptor domain-containing protein [Phthorimaea operculella]|nr:7tm odorant receptor domain-containing protein [Phthorimaea operculella]